MIAATINVAVATISVRLSITITPTLNVGGLVTVGTAITWSTVGQTRHIGGFIISLSLTSTTSVNIRNNRL